MKFLPTPADATQATPVQMRDPLVARLKAGDL